MSYMSLLLAFVGGGIACAVAQIFIDLTKLTPARILVGYVVVGVLLYAFGAYDWLYEAVGCGISVPLVGFGASVAKGVKTAIDETGALGILTGGLTATAGGIAAALFLGFLASLLFRGKAKKM